MNFLQRVCLQWWWLVVLLVAAGVLRWSTAQRVARIDYISGLARPAGVENASAGPAANTSSARHNLIISERNEASVHLLLQTQQMRERHELRIRHVDYDNAPQGRPVRSTSAYRWWLGLVARADQALASHSTALALERSALWADPAIRALLLLLGTTVMAFRFGPWAAAVFAIGLVAWFPLAASFGPGSPDPRILGRALGIGQVLLVLGALWAGAERRAFTWWISAGVCGGVGMWVDLPTAVPIISGIAVGGVMAGWACRRGGGEEGGSPSAGWRAWSVSGAITVLVLHLVEYAPHHLGEWTLESLHPLHGLAWLGIGELLRVAYGWPTRRAARLRATVMVLFAGLAIAAVPLAARWSGSRGYALTDLASFRLTPLPGGVVAQSTWAWLSRDGVRALLIATVLPLLLLVPGIVLLLRRTLEFRARLVVTFLSGPIAVAVALALQQLSWWSVVGAMMLLLASILVASGQLRAKGWVASVLVAVMTIALVGVRPLGLGRFRSTDVVLTSAEAEVLIERDVAQWIATHSTDVRPVVFAPPRQTLSFAYFGDLRGIGTFAPENQAGFGTALTLAGVRTMEEVQGVIESRGVRWVVIPSWDPFFDEFARNYLDPSLAGRKSFFVGELRRYNLPSWLRPLSYPMPVIQGFEQHSALIFEVVEPQSPSIAASRLAEYFVESGDVVRAGQMIETLRKFPGDVGALAAQAQVLNAGEDAAGLASILESITGRLKNAADRFLLWDRRVSLAVVLAHGDKLELARDQTARCIADVTETRLRSLSGDALYGLLVLSNTFEVPMADPRLRTVALGLLPPELRQRL